MTAIVWSSILTDHEDNSLIGLGYGLGTTRKMKERQAKKKMEENHCGRPG